MHLCINPNHLYTWQPFLSFFKIIQPIILVRVKTVVWIISFNCLSKPTTVHTSAETSGICIISQTMACDSSLTLWDLFSDLCVSQTLSHLNHSSTFLSKAGLPVLTSTTSPISARVYIGSYNHTHQRPCLSAYRVLYCLSEQTTLCYYMIF